MRISAKQIDEVVRFLGTISAAAFTGAVVGATGRGNMTGLEIVSLGLAFALSFGFVLILRSEPS